MKRSPLPRLITALLMFIYSGAFSNPTTAGFFLPDSIRELSLEFKTLNNLIVLPVTINDSVQVNLILDTGCRNLVLFGKQFQKVFNSDPKHKVMFSGLGSGNPVEGKLSLNNHVSIESITGEKVPIVIVSERNIFSRYKDIHGVIGYDIFLKFEIEINSKTKRIVFRPAAHAIAPAGYSQVSLNIVDSRPVMNATIFFSADKNQSCELMIDTGSSIGLLLKTTEIEKFEYPNSKNIVIGQGLNGVLTGYETVIDKLSVNDFDMRRLTTGIIESQWHNYASIGMDVLKDYIVVLNYCKSYACFKKLSA